MTRSRKSLSWDESYQRQFTRITSNSSLQEFKHHNKMVECEDLQIRNDNLKSGQNKFIIILNLSSLFFLNFKNLLEPQVFLNRIDFLIFSSFQSRDYLLYFLWKIYYITKKKFFIYFTDLSYYQNYSKFRFLGSIIIRHLVWFSSQRWT